MSPESSMNNLNQANSQTSQPKVIFLDAVGTLFGVKDSVGAIYGAIARQWGVMVSPEMLNQAFYDSFKAATPLAFPGVNPSEIIELEFQWWEDIAKDTFARVGVLDRFSNFTSFFTQLYAHFATAEPWFIYPDVIPALQHWQKKGIELGIISNFDTRIYTVLELLGLTRYFSSVTISSSVGAAKPNSLVFQTALDKHRCQPSEAWHIGDSFQEDYQGALEVGMRAILVER